MNKEIEKFCDKHAACTEMRVWALACGATTMDDLWLRSDLKPEWRIWIGTQPGVLDDKTLRLFACWCVRQVWDLLTDPRSRNTVEVAERFADGQATADELAAASDAAWAAAWAAAMAAAWAAQAQWLIEHTMPMFGEAGRGEGTKGETTCH